MPYTAFKRLSAMEWGEEATKDEYSGQRRAAEALDSVVLQGLPVVIAPADPRLR
jgi:hypothetical protein